MNVKVLELLAKYTEKEMIEETNSLSEDLAIDSLNMVQLMLDIEDTFNIKLEESDMNPYDLTSVSSVNSLVEKYLGSK